LLRRRVAHNGLELSGPAKSPSDYRAAVAGSACPGVLPGLQRVVRRRDTRINSRGESLPTIQLILCLSDASGRALALAAKPREDTDQESGCKIKDIVSPYHGNKAPAPKDVHKGNPACCGPGSKYA